MGAGAQAEDSRASRLNLVDSERVKASLLIVYEIILLLASLLQVLALPFVVFF